MNISRARRRAALAALAAAVVLPVIATALAPTTATAAPLPVVSGRVVDLAGEPVQNAQVSVPGGFTLTDETGRFSMSSEGDTLSLHVILTPPYPSTASGQHFTHSLASSTTRLGGPPLSEAGLDLGDVEIPRPSRATAVRVLDPDGDPIRYPTWVEGTTGSVCSAAERPDGAEGDYCYTLDANGGGGGGGDGRLRFLLPESRADELGEQALAAASIRIEDPATSRIYIERASDAVPNAGTGEYVLTVPGTDAPPIPLVSSPTNIVVEADHERARVSWIQPPGDAMVIGHTVTATAPGHPTISAYTRSGSRLTGLTNDVTYTVRVVANSEYGTDSPPSAPVQVTPYAPTPRAPVVAAARIDPGVTTLLISYDTEQDERALAYNLRCTATLTSLDGSVTRENPLSPGSGTWAITDIPKGLTYEVGGVCENDHGTAVGRPHMVTFGSAPGRMSRPSVKVSANRKVKVAWRPVKSNGGPVTYRVSWNGNEDKYKVKDGRTSIVIKKVPRRTHRVQIIAQNAVGISMSPVRRVKVR